MNEPSQPGPAQKKGLTAIDGALSLIAVLLIVQMWLLSATLESYLAGHHEAAYPACVISGIIFATCAVLFVFIHRVDANVRKR